MENYISVLEISDTQIRLAVGFVRDDKVNLIHVAERPIRGLVSRGEIIDFQTISSIISSMKEFRDETTKERFTINEVTLILPSLGLNVFQSSKTSNVVSSESTIQSIDIENVISLVSKEPLPAGSEIVDIIPDSFILEMGRSFINPPISEKSNSITIKAKIQTLPNRVVEDYKRVLEGARLKLRRLCVSSYAISELARYDESIPDSYILVDIGADITNVSLIGNNSPFATVSFISGATDLINKVASRFGISNDDALELIKKYGLDERELTYKPVIASSFMNGLETKQDPEGLNNIIKEFYLEDYFPKFDIAYETLMKGYADNVRNLPVVFTGGLSKMFGFEGLMKEKFSSNASLHYLEPRYVGARDTSFSALIGAIYASKYKGTYSDTRFKNNQLHRVKNSNE